MAHPKPIGTPPLCWHGLAWASILVAIGVTQALRIVLVDASIFFLVAVLIVVDSSGALRCSRQSWPRPPRGLPIAAFLVLAAALVLAPRHGVLLASALGLSGLAVLALAWVPRARTGPVSTKRSMARSMTWWAGLIAAIGLWELASFVFSFTGEAASYNHPTVSDLLDSALDTFPGRVVFATVWLVLGTVVVRPQQAQADPIRDRRAPRAGGGGG